MSSSSSGVPQNAAVANLSQADQAPGFFYGWMMLPLATMALIATSPGQTYSVSTFNPSFSQSLSISQSQLTGAYMIGTFLASLPMGYIGAIMDRHGLRKTLTVITILFGGVCILTSQVTGLVTLFLAFLFLRMLGQGAMGLLSGNTLAFWFERKLGTVEGIRHVGMAGAIAILPAINLWLIDAVGWRWTYAILGLTVWAIMLPALFWLWRDHPEEVNQFKDGLPPKAGGDEPVETIHDEARTSLTFREATKTRAYWIVIICMAFWSMLSTAMMFNILPFFASRGLEPTDAAWLFSVFAVCVAVMHVVGGILADRVPLNLLLAVSMTGLVMTMAIAWQLSHPATVYLLGASMGLTQGLLVAVAGPVWPRYYGRSHMGQIRGTMATVTVASSSVGPFIMGVGFDLLGNYDMVMLFFALAPAPMILLSLLATVPDQRRQRLAEIAA